MSIPIDLSSCKRDETHYFEDVYLLVGDTIFRLPRHHFEQDSPKFREMFGLPGSPKTTSPIANGGVGNQLKENPLHRLTDIDINDFRQFLKVLYPRNFGDDNLKPAQWISVLKLSTAWGFKKVRDIAIKALEEVKMTGIKGGLSLLMLAQTYDVQEWFLPALRLLAEKTEFKEEYVAQLTLPTSIRVISLQGLVAGYRLQKSAKGGKPDLTPTEIDGLIKKTFPEVEVSKESGGVAEGSGANGTKDGLANANSNGSAGRTS